jgi:hypothetical protein
MEPQRTQRNNLYTQKTLPGKDERRAAVLVVALFNVVRVKRREKRLSP